MLYIPTRRFVSHDTSIASSKLLWGTILCCNVGICHLPQRNIKRNKGTKEKQNISYGTNQDRHEQKSLFLLSPSWAPLMGGRGPKRRHQLEILAVQAHGAYGSPTTFLRPWHCRRTRITVPVLYDVVNDETAQEACKKYFFKWPV